MRKLFITTNNAEQPARARVTVKPLSRLVSYIFSGLLLALPPASNAAPSERAVPTSQLRAFAAEKAGTYRIINGTETVIGTARQRERVYLVYRAEDINPGVRIQGPAQVSMLFYPIISRPLFKINKPAEQRIAYSVDGVEAVHISTTHLSTFRTIGFSLDSALAIGAPIRFVIPVDDGSHQIFIIAPNGFFRVEGIAVLSAGSDSASVPVLHPQSRPTIAASRPVVLQKPPSSRQYMPPKVKIAKEPKTESPLLLDSTFRRIQFNGLRDNDSGAINEFDFLLRRPRINNRLWLLFDLYVDSSSLYAENSDTITRLNLLSAGAGVGVALITGPHNIYVIGFGGIKRIMPVIYVSGTETSTGTETSAGYGLRAGYDYNEKFGISVRGSNDPLSPGMLVIYASIPYTLVRTDHPKLEINARWLHTIDQGQILDGLLANSLSRNEFLVQINGFLPFVRLGPVTLAVRTGIQTNLGDTRRLSPFAGGGVNVRFHRFAIEGAATATFDGKPNFLLDITAR